MTTSRGPATWRSLVPLVGSLCLTLAACSAAPPSPPGGGTSAPPVGTFVDRPVDPSVLALPLTDEHGRRTSLKALAGTTVVITDFLTTCQEICPMTSVDVRAAARAAAAAHVPVEFLEVTVDPARDDVAHLRAYMSLFGSQPNWHVLTAGAGTAALWKELGVYLAKVPSDDPPPRDWFTGKVLTYDVTHQDAVFVVDGAGHERWITQGTPVIGGERLPPAMRTYLNEQGRANLASPAGPTWSAADVLAAVSAVTGRPVA